MPFNERKAVIEGLKKVDSVIDFEDDETGSATNALKKIKNIYPNEHIIFANGGDRNQSNIPEMSIDGIDFVFSVGGDDKKNSSSWILKKWQYYFEERVWGSFFNLFDEGTVKVKELIVEPEKGMSFQKHFKRNEIWLVSKGSCLVNFSKGNPEDKEQIKLNKFDQYNVPVGEWHQITNPYKQKCHIIEIQYGEECSENDIERTELYSPK